MHETLRLTVFIYSVYTAVALSINVNGARDPPCGPNESALDFRATCETTCNNLNHPLTRLPWECAPQGPTAKKCFCNAGFVRVNGICVPLTKCLECKGGELPMSFYYKCESTCDDPRTPLQRDVAGCLAVFPLQLNCFCAPGFVRIKGVCEPYAKCSNCLVNESAENIRKSCEPTCENVHRMEEPYKKICESKELTCFCKPGYVRIDGVCRPAKECPRKPSVDTATQMSTSEGVTEEDET